MHRLFIILILATGVSLITGYIFTTYAYYPKLAHSRGVGQGSVGLIMGLNAIPFMIVSVFSPLIMKRWGRKACLLCSLTLCSLSVFTFALLNFVHDQTLFFIVSLLSRMLTGATMSLYVTTSYSLVSILYKDSIQKGMGRIQASIGIGPIVCLISSTFIFKWFGYFVTFALISGAMIATCVLIAIFIEHIQEEDQQDENAEVKLHAPNKSTYIFKDFRIIATVVSSIIAMTIIDAPSSLVSDRFSDFDLPEYLKGLTFLFSNVPFTIVSLLLHRFTHTSYKAKRVVMCGGYVLLCIGFLLIGPSAVFHFPDQVWLILLGFSWIGASFASLIVTSLPLLQDYAMQYDTVGEEYSTVANYISALSNLSLGLGGFLGQMIAPNIKIALGYKGFTDLFALCCIIGLLIFLGLSSVPLSNHLRMHHKVKKYRGYPTMTTCDTRGSLIWLGDNEEKENTKPLLYKTREKELSEDKI